MGNVSFKIHKILAGNTEVIHLLLSNAGSIVWYSLIILSDCAWSCEAGG